MNTRSVPFPRASPIHRRKISAVSTVCSPLYFLFSTFLPCTWLSRLCCSWARQDALFHRVGPWQRLPRPAFPFSTAATGISSFVKLEAYHQSRQPQSCFLLPFCVLGLRLALPEALRRHLQRAVAAAVFSRPCRCGDFGFVSRHKPAEHCIPDVSATPDVEASYITSCRGRRVTLVGKLARGIAELARYPIAMSSTASSA